MILIQKCTQGDQNSEEKKAMIMWCNMMTQKFTFYPVFELYKHDDWAQAVKLLPRSQGFLSYKRTQCMATKSTSALRQKASSLLFEFFWKCFNEQILAFICNVTDFFHMWTFT